MKTEFKWVLYCHTKLESSECKDVFVEGRFLGFGGWSEYGTSELNNLDGLFVFDSFMGAHYYIQDHYVTIGDMDVPLVEYFKPLRVRIDTVVVLDNYTKE